MGSGINKRMLVISLIFGIVTFMGTTLYLGSVSKDQKFKAELISVITAKANIPPRTVITKDMVQNKSIPRQYALPGVFVQPQEVIGKITNTPIILGEQIVSGKVSVRGQQLGLSFIVPKNKRAVSVEVDAAASIAGLIKPGDMVDILCTLTGDFNRTVTVLQNVQILAIDRAMDTKDQKNEGKVDRSVIATFALDLRDAEKVVQASTAGQLRLVLRATDDHDLVQSFGTTTTELLPYRRSAGGGSAYSIRVVKGTDVSRKTF